MKRVLILLFTVVLSACGGGGSSSGGSSSAGNNAGIYNGTVTLTVSQFGTTTTATDTIRIEIQPNGRVIIIDSEGDRATGTLSGNSYVVNYQDNIVVSGTTICEASGTFRGTVNGNTTRGTVTGTLCINPVPANITGNFEASK